jgi:hypothetical protein
MKNKTIFFGNGLNYLSDNSIGWKDLLKKMMNGNKFEINQLPNIMAYERIRLNWNRAEKTKHLKTEISELLKNQPTNEYYQKLLETKCKNFITTNYDYALNKAFSQISDKNKIYDINSEELYSIRRKTDLIGENWNIKSKIWNIHGEINNPKSIMLGLNHYNGSIAKIGAYLKGTYDFRHKGQTEKVKPIEEKLEINKFDNHSWIELFFNSNVHIAGFGFDFSEIDLWWILTKRARLAENSLISNKIFYYTKPIGEVKKEYIEIEKRKRELLDSFGVNVEDVSASNGYPEFWDNIIQTINTSS